MISLRELVESFDKKTDAFLNDGRKMLNDLSKSIRESRFGTTPPAAR